jgi:hypothetical protein
VPNERKNVVVCMEEEDEDCVKVKLENVAERYVVGCVSFSDWKRKKAKLKSGVLTELQMKGERREEIKKMEQKILKCSWGGLLGEEENLIGSKLLREQ